MKKYSDHLEELVEQRTAELRAVNEKLQLEIHELKRKEETLMRSATIPELNPNPVIEVDLKGHIYYLNPAAKRLLPDIQAAGLKHPFLAGLKSAADRFQKGVKTSHMCEVKVGDIWFEQICFYSSETQLVYIYAFDISERKRMEDALIESERRYHTLSELSPVGMFYTDAEGDCTYVNERWQEIAGLTLEEALGKGWIQGLHPDDRDRISEEWYRAAKEHRPFKSEYRFQRPDGTTTWVLGQATAERNNSGDVTGYVGTITDITERKRAEEVLRRAHDELEMRVEERTAELAHANEALQAEITERKRAEETIRESEERYRNLVELSPDAIAVHSEGKVAFINPAGAKLFGAADPGQLIGKNIMDLVHPDYREDVKERIRQMREEGKVVPLVEEKFLRLDGSVIDVEVKAMPITYRGKTGTLVLIRDITERKHTEERLRLFSNLCNLTNDAIFVDDTETGHILNVNERACRNLGYTREELLNMHAFDIEATLPDYSSWKEHVNEVKKKGYIIIEGLHRRKDGTTFPVEVNATYTAIGEKSYIVAVVRDITERKKIEERLRLFRDLINRSNDAIFVDDTETARILYVNDRACRNLGYTREELLNMHAFDIEITLPDYSLWKEHVNDIKKKGYVVVEGKHRRKDGTIFPVEVNVSYITIGENSYMVAVARDITNRKRGEEELRRAYDELGKRVEERTAELAKTNKALQTEINERKQAEEALRLSEANLQAIINNTTAVIYVKDTKGRYIMVNRQYENLFNIKNEQIKGKTDYDIFSKEIADTLRANDLKVLQARASLEFDELIPQEDGLHTYISIKFPLYDPAGNPYAVCGISTDITERKRIEEELQRSIRQLNAILDNIPDIAWLKDRESRFIAVNKPFADSCGRRPEELVGKTDYDIWPKELAERYRADDREVMETGRRKQVVEPLIDKEGKRTWIETIKTPIYDERGNVIGTTGIARDVTERKRMEEEREKWTAELARSNAELEQFANIVSHDLQEPLRMISGFTQLLAKRYKGKLDKNADEFIAYIVDGTVRMQRMIEDLLTYSRVGTRAKTFKPTNLETIFDQAIANLKVAIEENGAVVTHDPLPTVMADASQMIQLFQNLIANGIKFRKKEEPPRIHVSAKRQGEEWVFSVRDNGIGIAPEFFGRLFQIFQRQYTADKYPGTGIGLAICRKIVERHGGRIWAESEPGKGSTFYFTIPVRKGE